jgi:hypothetical protein
VRESVVTASLAEAFPALVEQILGGAGAAAVEAELERLPGLGAPVAACFRCELSVGALFGLELADGRRVALKVHQAHVTPRDVDAVQSAQGHLAASGLPCPRPVLGPTPFLGRVASAEEWLDEGEPAETVDPARRRAMAHLLARQIELCRDLPAGSVLDWPPDDDRLWGTPHNALFDFDATAAGAERIDEVARAALRLHRAGPRVLAHQDWTLTRLPLARRPRDRDLRLGLALHRPRVDRRRGRGGDAHRGAPVSAPVGAGARGRGRLPRRVRARAPAWQDDPPRRRGARRLLRRLRGAVRARARRAGRARGRDGRA